MQTRRITIEEAFNIVQRVHEDMRWRPHGSTSRDQRNAWFETAVAVVHYGHPLFNPAGGDRRWCIKNGGGGRPQSDDIIVDVETRAYYDLIGATGTDDFKFSLGRHSEPLPANQPVYPPSKDSLGVLPGPTDPPVVEPGDPQPPPEPPTGDLERDIADLKAMLTSVVETQTSLLNGIGLLASAVNDLSTRQEQLFADQTKRLFGTLEENGVRHPGIAEETVEKVRDNLDANPIRSRPVLR